jgi:N-acetylglucosaminyldiphosphoundecaprenol N-acetyl-beta-D-mannosaminyltransferase
METANLSLPDSVPFLWYGRHLGFENLKNRCGIEEVMDAVFEMSNDGAAFRHFFYGNTPQVLEGLKKALLLKYPKLNICGMLSPPFRPLSKEEDDEYIKKINAATPDFLWVSLGCPKQETWLYDHRHSLKAVVGGGSGAVFNFFSGDSKKAPNWIRYLGMEWLLRLFYEPKRLWKRYLIKYPKFLLFFAANYFLSSDKHA